MKELDLLKDVRKRTLDSVISKFGGVGGEDLNDKMLSIIDVKEILYYQIGKIAKEIVVEEFK